MRMTGRRKPSLREGAKRFRRPRRLRATGSHAGGKRAANVSIDREILDEAKKLNINLSQTLEDTLRQRVEDVRIEKWQRKNKAMFDFMNDFFERNGTLSEAILDLDDPSV